MKAEERLWLNKDRTKVVKEGDKEAASLLAAPGQDIAREYEGLVEVAGSAPAPEDETVKDDNKKDAGKPPGNKDAGAPPENKAENQINKII